MSLTSDLKPRVQYRRLGAEVHCHIWGAFETYDQSGRKGRPHLGSGRGQTFREAHRNAVFHAEAHR